MSRLRSCYFCGTAGDALQEYEVVPAEVADDAHSAILCPDCHEKLRRVVEPFVDAGGGSAGATAAHQEVTFGGTSSDAGGDASDGVDATPTDDTEGDDDAGGADDDPEDDGPLADSAPGAVDGATDGHADGESDDDEDVPDGYYKVLRLLQNREFPMERSELTTLMTGAYDITEPQCERILETAIERGVLVEDGSTLDLGRN